MGNVDLVDTMTRGAAFLDALAGRPVTDLVDFYHRVWAMGGPGVDVPLTILRDGRDFDVRVRSADRYRFLSKEPTF